MQVRAPAFFCPRGCAPAIKGRCMQIKVSLSTTRVFSGDSLCGPAVYLLLWWQQEGHNFKDGKFQGKTLYAVNLMRK